MKLLYNRQGVQSMGIIIGIVVLVIVAGGVYYFMTSDAGDEIDTNAITTNTDTNSTVNAQADTNTEMDMNANSATANQNVNKDATNANAESTAAAEGEYVDYSEETYASTADRERVLFFYAAWCPTCRIADQDINDNLGTIPDGVVILKTDYDTEDELKDKYGITYQHTFVHVDANGDVITKWNGGGVDSVAQRVN